MNPTATKTPDHCKGCLHLHLGGSVGPWCCYFGKGAPKALGECKLKGGKLLPSDQWTGREWRLLDNLPKASVRKLLEIGGRKLCTFCNARGLVHGPQDYLGDLIATNCPRCHGKGFVPNDDC